jgi:hypothetical protein
VRPAHARAKAARLIDFDSFALRAEARDGSSGAPEPVKIVLPILSNDRKWRKAAFFLLN